MKNILPDFLQWGACFQWPQADHDIYTQKKKTTGLVRNSLQDSVYERSKLSLS